MTRSEPKSRRAGRTAARCLFLLLALSLSPTVAFAHAKLTRSQPEANSTLEESPKFVELWFNEGLETGFSTIEVKNQAGARVDRGEVTLSEEGKKAQVELASLEAGKFSVTWKVLSRDGHTIRGEFSFTVAAMQAAATLESTPPPAEQQLSDESGATQQQDAPESAGEESAGESSITWADNAVRWLTYLAMMTLFGGFAFRLFVLAPALLQARPEDRQEGKGAYGAGARRVAFLSWVSVLLLAVTFPTALLLQASAVFDKPLAESLSPSLLGRVITETGYGVSWLLGVLATAALAAVLFFLGRRDRRAPSSDHGVLWWAGLAAGAALLLAPSLTGHAAASVKDYRFAVVTDWLHLLAGGFWVGGLFHLALCAPPALSHLSVGDRVRALRLLITRFTRMAVPSVALLALAGLYNTWVHVPDFQALWSTPYGRTLLVKLALVLTMLLLGGLNIFYFGRRAARAVKAGGPGEEGSNVERGFSRSVALEASLGVLVLLVTAVLVFLTPARNHPSAVADVPRTSLSDMATDK